jgi:hypothetical protein
MLDLWDSNPTINRICPFHGGNTGSNPVGDAKSFQVLGESFALHSKVQKDTFWCPFCTLEPPRLGRPDDLVVL